MRIICLMMLLCCFAGLQAAKTVKLQHVEPKNWFVGMKNPGLQLMIHGQGIGDCQVEVSYPGVELESVEPVESANYLFVNLRIASDAKAGSLPVVLRRNGKVVLKFNYELKERGVRGSDIKGFNSCDAIYLIMPDRFANANPANDNIEGFLEKADRNAPYGRHGGDLEGIMQHLDYIQGLGMTALWLNPVQENNMPASSYHGYAITDYSAVDARLGTMEEYKKLVEACHARGIKMVQDMVFNHCGLNHWWMNDLPMASWINHSKEQYVKSNYRLSTIADPHASKADFNLATKGWFDDSMPDMNLANPKVATYFIQNSIWWIETMDLDGIRQDTYPYPDKEAMRQWNLRINEEYPDFNIVGESWIGSTAKVAYWQKDARNADGYNSELKTIMDFPLQEAMAKAFNEGAGWDRGLQRLYDVLANDMLYANPMNLLVFGENHDTGRWLNFYRGDVDKLKMATVFVACVRGIPQLYVGTEILMDGNGAQHSEIRKDYPGGWAGDEYNAFTNPKPEHKDMYDFMARIFKFRQQSPALMYGSLTHFIVENNVYVFFRQHGDETVMVVLNGSGKEIDGEDYTIRYAECLGGRTSGTDVLTGNAVDLKKLNLKNKKAAVIQIGR